MAVLGLDWGELLALFDLDFWDWAIAEFGLDEELESGG